MAWKDWPKWVKILAVISLVMIILLEAGLVMVFLFLKSAKLDFPSEMGMLILIVLMIYYFLVIAGLWGLGFLMRYLIKRKLYLTANIIAVLGLVISSIWFLRRGIKDVFSFSLSLGQFVTGIILYGWFIIIIIYFIVALVLINKARKQY